MADKMTKKDYFAEIKAIVEASDNEIKENIIDFIDHEIDLIDTKARKSAERAAEKRKVSDEIRGMVQELLSDEWQTAETIAMLLDNEEISKAKVSARLTQLCKENIAEKEQIRQEDGRRLMMYRLYTGEVNE